jgi:uncharacterized membrane protein YphA (DoxX/SURF4 family)
MLAVRDRWRQRAHSAPVHRACFAAGVVVAFLFVAAALLKLASLEDSERSVRTWSLLPVPAVRPIVLLLPPLELALGAAWLLGVARRLVAVAIIGLLSALTVAYTAHVLVAQPPECGCAGLFTQFERQIGHAWTAIARNVVLVLMALLSLLGANLHARAVS